jgi:hypothetical protein
VPVKGPGLLGQLSKTLLKRALGELDEQPDM